MLLLLGEEYKIIRPGAATIASANAGAHGWLGIWIEKKGSRGRNGVGMLMRMSESYLTIRNAKHIIIN